MRLSIPSVHLRLALVLGIVGLCSCGDDGSPGSSMPDASGEDSGAEDAAMEDASEPRDTGPGDTGPTDAGPCGYERGVSRGTVSRGALDEISGVAASRRTPGVLWVHNDSGDEARVFALAENGEVRQEFALLGAENVDFEDIAVGPGPDGPSVYVGDTGDNAARAGEPGRSNVQIYRFAEPAIGGPSEVTVERFDLTYPDQAHDAEALFVNPEGRVFVITKVNMGDGQVFAAPHPLESGEFEAVGRIRMSFVTAADMRQDGEALLVRNYFFANEVHLPPGTELRDALGDGVVVRFPSERQAESVAYDTNTPAGLFSISEGDEPDVHYLAPSCP